MTSQKRKRRDSRQNKDDLSRENKIQKKNVVILSVSLLFMCVCGEFFSAMMNKLSQVKSNASKSARKRLPGVRTTWAKENERITDRMFYRLFRMKRPCFNALCAKIERAIGENTFKSERYIENLKKKWNFYSRK